MAKKPDKNKQGGAPNRKSGAKKASRKVTAGAIILIAVTVFVSYLPSIQNDFVTTWDDGLYVTNNPLILDLSPKGVQNIFRTPVAGNYHPITILSLAINYRIGGFNPAGYHLTNLIIHIGSSILVFVFIRALMRNKSGVALITAMLFGIHPMHVESVAWISERKDVLYTFFFFTSLIAYTRYIDNRSRPAYYLITIFSFLLAVLSKAVAVTLPVVFLLVDYFLGRRISKKAILEKVPFFLLSIAFGLIAIKCQAQVGTISKVDGSYIHKIVYASYGFIAYIYKMFYPMNLSAYYPYPSGALPRYFFLFPILSITIVAAAAWSLRYTKLIAFGLGFYFVTVALVLQFMPVGEALIADRYSYVPHVGLMFMVGALFGRVSQIQGQRKSRQKLLAAVIPTSLVLILSAMTYHRSSVWKNSETMWSDVVRKHPTVALAFNNRGNYYLEVDVLDKALTDFNQALSLKPNYYDAHINRGRYYFAKNNLESALNDFNKAISINSMKVEGYNNRGGANFQLGRYESALKDFEKVIEMDSAHDKAYHNVGAIYHNLGKMNQAIENYNRALAINPGNTGCLIQRSRAHNALGQTQNALDDLLRAQQLGAKIDNVYMDSLTNPR